MKTKLRNLVLFLTAVLIVKVAIAEYDARVGFPNLPTDTLSGSIITSDNIVSLTNASRRAFGVFPLHASRPLRHAAQKKARDMLRKQYFAHVNPVGKEPWDFIEDAGYDYYYAGENLAIHFRSAEAVTKGWLLSRSHQENLLSQDFTEIGVGVLRGKFQGQRTTLVVQMFGTPYADRDVLLTRQGQKLPQPQNLSEKPVFLPTASLFDLFPGATIGTASLSFPSFFNVLLLSITFFGIGLILLPRNLSCHHRNNRKTHHYCKKR